MWKIKFEGVLEVDPGWDMDDPDTKAHVLGPLLGHRLRVTENGDIDSAVGTLKINKHLKVSKDVVVAVGPVKGGAA